MAAMTAQAASPGPDRADNSQLQDPAPSPGRSTGQRPMRAQPGGGVGENLRCPAAMIGAESRAPAADPSSYRIRTGERGQAQGKEQGKQIEGPTQPSRAYGATAAQHRAIISQAFYMGGNGATGPEGAAGQGGPK